MNLRLIGGLALWLGFLAGPMGPGAEMEIARILALALLVVLPLGFDLSRRTGEASSNMFAAAKYLQPFAAVVVASSFFLPAGVLAGTLAIAWLPLTGLLAIDAFNRIRQRGLAPLEELAVDTAGLYLPVGAVWLWASRMGLEPFGFTEPIVLLTAVHFHFAGFGGPLLAGLTGRFLRSRDADLPLLYTPSAALVLIGPALVAAGFFLPPNFEALAAALLAAGYLGLSLVILSGVVRPMGRSLPGLLLATSALAVLFAMAAATAYAVGNASRVFFIPIPTMVLVHGWLNAAGFVLLGLLGWAVKGVDTDQAGANR